MQTLKKQPKPDKEDEIETEISIYKRNQQFGKENREFHELRKPELNLLGFELRIQSQIRRGGFLFCVKHSFVVGSFSHFPVNLTAEGRRFLATYLLTCHHAMGNIFSATGGLNFQSIPPIAFRQINKL